MIVPTIPIKEVKTSFVDGKRFDEAELGRAFLVTAFAEGEILTAAGLNGALDAVRDYRARRLSEGT